MNAVATPTRKAVPKAVPKAQPAKAAAHGPTATDDKLSSEFTPEAITAAFQNIQTLLDQACSTDEPHAWSGDSDRLLRIAHYLAGEARVNTSQKGELIDCAAFDIAALIRAARLVPGDEESPTRQALIGQAAMHLNWLTECDQCGEDCCDPGVQRPMAPVRKPSPLATNTNDADLASIHLGEAEAVIRAAAETETGPTRGAALLAAALVTGLAKECIPLGVAVDRKALSDAGALLSQAEAVLELVTQGSDDLLADAGLTLLLAAQDLISSAEDEVHS